MDPINVKPRHLAAIAASKYHELPDAVDQRQLNPGAPADVMFAEEGRCKKTSIVSIGPLKYPHGGGGMPSYITATYRHLTYKTFSYSTYALKRERRGIYPLQPKELRLHLAQTIHIYLELAHQLPNVMGYLKPASTALASKTLSQRRLPEKRESLRGGRKLWEVEALVP